MDRLFEDGFSRPWRMITAQDYETAFPVEVWETESDVEVKAALPGMRPDEVDITITNDVLTIKAEHREEAEDKKREYFRREIRYGVYHRSMGLPVGVDADKATARFENGMLHLTLPKAEAMRPKQIKVSAKETITGEAGHTADGA
jgi:HSP20 family protein